MNGTVNDNAPIADDAMAAHAAKMVFPIGGVNTFCAEHFIGGSYLAPLAKEPANVINVTFEPGSRNCWHIHHADEGGGHVLLCLAGRGYYQEWGAEPVELNPGDVVCTAAGVKHWHGAAPDSWFTHLCVELPGKNTSSEWLDFASEEEYASLP